MPRRQEAGLACQRRIVKEATVPSYRADGHLQALPVTELMLHFDGDALPDEHLRRLYAQSLAAMAGPLTHFRTDPMTRSRPKPDLADDVAQAWTESLAEDRWALHAELTSGESPETVGPWSIRWHVPGQWQRQGVAALRLTWPVEFGLQRSPELERVFAGLAAVLPGAWGSAGFGIEYDTRATSSDRDRAIRAWCGRFRGLVHRDFDDVLWSEAPSFTSASWLNLLPAEWNLEGNAHGLDTAAEPASAFSQRFVKTAPQPTLGDRNRRDDVSGMAALQAQIRDYLTTPEQLPAGFDEDVFLMWLDRFDPRS